MKFDAPCFGDLDREYLDTVELWRMAVGRDG